MAKKWGKRGKQDGRGGNGMENDPRNMFGVPPSPRNAPPASSTPLADYLRRGWPGVDQQYVVLPRSIVEAMPLPWQQQMTNLLGQFHDTHGRLSWPAYRVVPSRPERLVDLDEEQLAEAGYLVEIDPDGEMVYRERSGRKVEDPDNTTVLVSCLDPIVRQAEQARAQASTEERPGPAPMNIGPQPVWRTTVRATEAPAAPPLPPPPTAPAVAVPERADEVQPQQPPEPRQQSEPTEPVADAAPAPPPVAPEPRTTEEDQPPETPPRGFSTQRGWFDELPGESTAQSGRESAEGFGPTGDEPTEIPYRYRP